MQLKVPTLSSSTSSYSAEISFNGITDNNYTIRSNYHFDIGVHDFEFGENPPVYIIAYHLRWEIISF